MLASFVYFSGLGRHGLRSTEGHRAIPAWTMAKSADPDDWLVPRLFERPYLRKPPGLQWAIASCSLVLGQTEFAARAALAIASTLSAVVSLVFAGRWFGWRWCIPVGPAYVLAPFTWATARTAEIEALNHLGTQLAVFALIDLLLRGRRSGTRTLVCVGAIGILIAGLAKGPASFPLLPATFLACCLITRSWAPLRSAGAWGATALGLAGIAGATWLIARAVADLNEPAVTQDVGEFLWSWSRLSEVAAMPLLALLTAMPLPLAALFPFGKDAHLETLRHDPRSTEIGGALALACVFALIAYAAVGMHNPRYAMPATCVLAPLVAYVWRGMGVCVPCRMSRLRRCWAMLFMVGHPVVLGCGLLIGFLVFTRTAEHAKGMTSGREAGIAIAPHLPDGATLIVRDLAEARPETIWYALREAERLGVSVEARWLPERIADHPPGTMLLLRTDRLSREAQGVMARGWPRLEPVASVRVHVYEATLYRVVAREFAGGSDGGATEEHAEARLALSLGIGSEQGLAGGGEALGSEEVGEFVLGERVGRGARRIGDGLFIAGERDGEDRAVRPGE